MPANQFVLVANPFDSGNNVLSNIIANATGASTVQKWNGSGFDVFTYNANQHSWKQGTISADATPIPLGSGFFVKASTSFTNTFVGSVVAASGAAATNSLSVGLVPVGSLVPYADVVTNSATFNLQVGGATSLQQWDVASQQYNVFTYNANQHTWKQGTINTNPVIGVAEGFFINVSAPTNWVQVAP